MSRDEALAKLKELARISDGYPEIAHGAADAILLDLINDSEISAAWDAVPKWWFE